MGRPRLTSKIVRGLREAASCISVNLENGECGAFASCDAAERESTEAALAYIYALATWHEKANAACNEAGEVRECDRCGHPIPRRRAAYSFCTPACERKQVAEDAASMADEIDQQEQEGEPAPEPAWTDEDVATWIDLRPDERLDVEDLASGARRTLPIRVANRLVRRGILSPLLRHDRVRLKGSRRYYAFVDLTDKGKRVAAYGASLREGSR